MEHDCYFHDLQIFGLSVCLAKIFKTSLRQNSERKSSGFYLNSYYIFIGTVFGLVILYTCYTCIKICT